MCAWCVLWCARFFSFYRTHQNRHHNFNSSAFQKYPKIGHSLLYDSIRLNFVSPNFLLLVSFEMQITLKKKNNQQNTIVFNYLLWFFLHESNFFFQLKIWSAVFVCVCTNFYNALIKIRFLEPTKKRNRTPNEKLNLKHNTKRRISFWVFFLIVSLNFKRIRPLMSGFCSIFLSTLYK